MKLITLTTAACVSQIGYVFYKYKIRHTAQTRSWFNWSNDKSSLSNSKVLMLKRKSVLAQEYSIEMYQYATCPFCNKVRVYLDYYGIPYRSIEVRPVPKPEMKWLKDKKKKVPTLKITNLRSASETMVLQESSQIVSLIHSFLNDNTNSETFRALAEHFENITSNSDDKAAKYTIKNYGLDDQDGFKRRELEWRRWADDTLVHVVAPNIYRSLPEALHSFSVITRKGNYGHDATWAPLYSFMATWIGASLMRFVIAPRLKKKNGLKEDVRACLYESVNMWMEEIGPTNKFHGGVEPDLADLAVFGVLRSMEDMSAFLDMLEYTRVGKWYGRMSRLCAKNSQEKRQLTSQPSVEAEEDTKAEQQLESEGGRSNKKGTSHHSTRSG